ncbi:MAG: hypothetical protein ACREOS_06220 [Candidatus Dormibacteraceae bacterium]
MNPIGGAPTSPSGGGRPTLEPLRDLDRLLRSMSQASDLEALARLLERAAGLDDDHLAEFMERLAALLSGPASGITPAQLESLLTPHPPSSEGREGHAPGNSRSRADSSDNSQ